MTTSVPQTPRVVVVGSINMDLVVRSARLPVPGETLIGHSLTEIPGGKGANQAVGAARLGANVSLIGRLGDDGFGKTLLLVALYVRVHQLTYSRAILGGVAAYCIEMADDGHRLFYKVEVDIFVSLFQRNHNMWLAQRQTDNSIFCWPL